jgi:integrase
MPLSDSKCKNAKAAEKKYKLADGGGLYLLVELTGAKYWRMKYRFAGKEKTLAIGVYPRVSLSEARDKREAAKKLLDEAQDPGLAKRTQKHLTVAKSEHTFEKVARAWHTKNLGDWKPAYAEKILQSLEKNVFQYIGKTPISEVTSADLLELLERIENRGALDIASRVKQRCQSVFDYAITKLHIMSNPVAPLKDSFQAPTPQNYVRLGVNELPEFYRRLAAYDGRKQTALAIRFLAYTFVRTGELRGARWSEFDFEAAQWTIPAERMKGKTRKAKSAKQEGSPQPHIVPLSRQVIAVLKELQTFTGDGALVFPGDRNPNKPISENTILFALYRMGYHSKMTGHGFRGIASTALNEMGFNPDWVERQLAHVERNKVRGAYNHAQYLPERTAMMQHWADCLDAIAVDNNVVAGKFGKAAA